MKVGHLLCSEGITAESFLGALIDAGGTLEVMQEPLDRAGISARLVAQRVQVRDVACVAVHVEEAAESGVLESVQQLQERVYAAALPPKAEQRARTVVAALARAEASTHGVSTDEVRFHELARPRGIARILAVAAGLNELAVERLTVGPIATGHGEVDIEHGRFPVPAPATMELLRGFTIYGGATQAEMTTPSGAALLAALAKPASSIPEFQLIGHGRGAIDRDGLIRLLTILIGDATS